MIKSKHAKYITNNIVSNYLVNSFFKTVSRNISNIEFNSILDVGCGEGLLLSYLSDTLKDKNCCAIDFDENEVKDALKNLPFCNVKVGSIYNIPFEDESFDLVTCTEVLEHLENPKRALEELYRVTKKYVLLSVPREPLWRLLNLARFSYIKKLGNTPGHLNHWSGTKFKRLIGEQFTILKYTCPIPWVIVLAEKKK